MLRDVLGVIAGSAAAIAFTFAAFSAAYLLLGAERAFKPRSFQVSTLWLILGFAVVLLAALLGGALCRLIARSMNPAYVLAAIVLVLGVVMAVPTLTAGEDEPFRRAGLTMLEAMTRARQPMVAAMLSPLIGAAGVVVGATLVDRASAARRSGTNPPDRDPALPPPR